MIVGAGSIGQRHLRIARNMSQNRKTNLESISVCLVSKHSNLSDYKTIEEGINKFQPTHILIATATQNHILDFNVIENNIARTDVLIEKPLFSKAISILEKKNNYYTAYNLRFSSVIEKLKQIVLQTKILNADIYVGSFLPEWRPNSDYRHSYSAKSTEGGGVLRDLSHELDYIVHLFGEIEKVSSICSKISNLEIESEDISSVLLKTKSGVIITLTLNYISRVPIRRITMISNTDTFQGDLINSSIQSLSLNEKYSAERDSTYIRQLESFLSDKNQLCSFDDGMYTLKLIESIEEASRLEKWVDVE